MITIHCLSYNMYVLKRDSLLRQCLRRSRKELNVTEVLVVHQELDRVPCERTCWTVFSPGGPAGPGAPLYFGDSGLPLVPDAPSTKRTSLFWQLLAANFHTQLTCPFNTHHNSSGYTIKDVSEFVVLWLTWKFQKLTKLIHSINKTQHFRV